MTDTCPPCHHNCNQGRTCPARDQRDGGYMRFVALVKRLAPAWKSVVINRDQ